MITGGIVAHPLGRAFDVLRFFRDTCESLPDEAMLVAGLQTAPDGSNARLVGILGGHSGPLEQGNTVFQPVRAFGPPVMEMMGPMPYTALNGMIDPAFPKGAYNFGADGILLADRGPSNLDRAGADRRDSAGARSGLGQCFHAHPAERIDLERTGGSGRTNNP